MKLSSKPQSQKDAVNQGNLLSNNMQTRFNTASVSRAQL